ncbi:ribonuclease H-like domain-containing protein [Stachybotrys elegans]|uniref:RNA exonuclease 4 n=1 Tax=Stachybotrys elegans TaxID=80388 RepID=A0A8K0T062_9HYPO|nr:ribonuclease H-like domain-containing protein [Stachybotrys elegans]
MPIMAELSSNWKKLQAKLQADSPKTQSKKRKTDNPTQNPPKKIKRSQASTTAVVSSAAAVSDKKMGGVQSTEAGAKFIDSPSPSLALWADDHDISAEVLAEAYDLGAKNNSMLSAARKDRINHGLTEGIEVGKYIAIDCEMVGIGPGGHESSLARVSIVDFHGRQIYDSYVKQREPVTNWRTSVSGISRKEMRFARDFDEVQKQVDELIQGRILVGHDIKHDLTALQLSHPPRDIRDTSKHPGFKKYGYGRKPSLRVLAHEILSVDIQSGAHSSIEDARVTMLLFRRFKSSFDIDHANRYAQKPVKDAKQPGKKSKKSRKG